MAQAIFGLTNTIMSGATPLIQASLTVNTCFKGTLMPTREKLKNYILENYLFTDDQSALNDSDSFMEQGIIDSTGIMEVVFFLEEEFDIQVQDEEMIPENLDSIDNLVAFVEKRQAS
jgi:acyl carrier protein